MKEREHIELLTKEAAEGGEESNAQLINNSEKITTNGGRRAGSGRPKGSLNRTRSEVRAIIESVIPLKEQFELLAQLSRGVTVKDKSTGIVYKEQPNVKALIALVEHSIGKPSQAIDITSDGEALVKNPFESLADAVTQDSKFKQTLTTLLESNKIQTSEKQETVKVESIPANGNGNGHKEKNI